MIEPLYDKAMVL